MSTTKTVDEALADLRVAMQAQLRESILSGLERSLNGIKAMRSNGRSAASRAKQARAMRRVWAAKRKKARAGK